MTALCAFALAIPATSGAAITWTRCDRGDVTQCATLPVPLDHSGKVTGAIKLHVERVRARDQAAKTGAAATTMPHGAIVALAGGPGQPATQFTSDFAFAFGVRDDNRDVVTFDQRGTGRSGLLRCPSVERVTLLSKYPVAGEQCADRLGAKRGFYTTSDSVDDLEAIRGALGVDKIAIYGASYGTKVALAYAARYPTHVERLILDSVLPLDGPDPLYGDTLAAMDRVERESCGDGCDFTKDAGGDLETFGKQLETRAAEGYVYDARGKRQLEAIGSTRLFFLMLAGDFAPDLRAALPGAIYSAAHGDPAVLLRLADLNEAQGEPATPEDFAAAVYAATLCEESPLPWAHGTPFDQRPGDAAAAAALRGQSAFMPLGTAAVLQSDLLALCERWPEATPAPAKYGPLPDVPTLILEGALDLRTPVEGAQRVAAQLPHTTFVTVPATGHSTLGSDASDCTLNAITRFLKDRTPRARCADPPAPLTATATRPADGRLGRAAEGRAEAGRARADRGRHDARRCRGPVGQPGPDLVLQRRHRRDPRRRAARWPLPRRLRRHERRLGRLHPRPDGVRPAAQPRRPDRQLHLHGRPEEGHRRLPRRRPADRRLRRPQLPRAAALERHHSADDLARQAAGAAPSSGDG